MDVWSTVPWVPRIGGKLLQGGRGECVDISIHGGRALHAAWWQDSLEDKIDGVTQWWSRIVKRSTGEWRGMMARRKREGRGCRVEKQDTSGQASMNVSSDADISFFQHRRPLISFHS